MYEMYEENINLNFILYLFSYSLQYTFNLII